MYMNDALVSAGILVEKDGSDISSLLVWRAVGENSMHLNAKSERGGSC